MAIFNVHEAKTQLSQLIARAEAGEEIIIARDGDPIVRLDLVRSDIIAERRRRARGLWKDKLDKIPDSVWFDPLPEEELRLWEGEGPLISGEPESTDERATPKNPSAKPASGT